MIQLITPAQELIKDTSHKKITEFKEHLPSKYNGNEFDYNSNDTGGVNLLQRLLRSIFNWFGDKFGIDIDFINYQTLEIIVYSLLGIIVLYLIIKFLLQSPINSAFKKAPKTIDFINVNEQEIKEIDFNTLISEAQNENNYRLAIRYLYLNALKHLSKKQIIDWHFDKTNIDYENEIKDTSIKSLFKKASYIYSYVWYGEFAIDEIHYNNYKVDFNNLLIKTERG